MITTEVRVWLAVGGLALAGCSNPGLDYTKHHPELTAAQTQILATGKIPDGVAVAGLTHAEIKLAMKGFPATFDKINGEEAWVYQRKKSLPLGMAADESVSPSQRKDMPDAFTPPPIYDLFERTTVFFTGDRATHATVVDDKP